MLVVNLVAIAGAMLVADVPPSGGSTETGKSDRLICRSLKVTGSRLSAEKRCLTAAQWAELKQLTRAGIERAQAQKPTSGQ